MDHDPRPPARIASGDAQNYYRLRDLVKGFVYERVPHVTLKSIANNPDIREGMTREGIDAAMRPAWATLYSTRSRPFPKPATGKVAAKVVNHYGDEVLKVYECELAGG